MNKLKDWWERTEEKPSQVKCETCKHWVDREDCQEVKEKARGIRIASEYYCLMHKKPYDGYYSDYPDIRKFYKTIPAREVEVDEEGNEITKKK